MRDILVVARSHPVEFICGIALLFVIVLGMQIIPLVRGPFEADNLPRAECGYQGCAHPFAKLPGE